MRALGFFSFLFFSLSLFCQEICLISAFCICCHDYSLSLPLPSLPLVFTYICLPGACMHEICLACVDMNAKMITRLKNITGETNRRRKLGQNADDLTSFHLHASLCSCINMCHKKWNQSTCTLHSVPVSICVTKMWNHSVCTLHSVAVSTMYTKNKKALVLLRMSAPQWVAMLIYSLPIKSRNRLDRDVFDTSVTHADLFHDVADTDCQKENCSPHVRVFATCKRRFSHKAHHNKSTENCYQCTDFFKYLFSFHSSRKGPRYFFPSGLL